MKHKSLQTKSAFGIILFRRKNRTWKLKGSGNVKKSRAILQPRFTIILIRVGGHNNNGMRKNLISLTDCGCVHHLVYSFQNYNLITYHLVKAATSKERAQIPIVDVDPAFCSSLAEFSHLQTLSCAEKKSSQ